MVAMMMATTGQADHGPEHDALQRDVEDDHERQGDEEPDEDRHAVVAGERRDHHAGDHHKLALGEVDRVGRLVDEHEAQRDEGVHQPDQRAVDRGFQKIPDGKHVHGKRSSPRPLPEWSGALPSWPCGHLRM
ncbi:MAG: hypothetical protein ACMVY4_15930 [Minwuia sp.]|uniref:hypothetical protein n=1 Tax=Minwuia sp. TaxID=2493630 RepID=UPI003A8BC06C